VLLMALAPPRIMKDSHSGRQPPRSRQEMVGSFAVIFARKGMTAADKSVSIQALWPRAQQENAHIYFVDESGVRSTHHAGTTSGRPKGQTPVVEATGARFSVNLLFAVGPRRAPCAFKSLKVP
jgi:hypothetical protein